MKRAIAIIAAVALVFTLTWLFRTRDNPKPAAGSITGPNSSTASTTVVSESLPSSSHGSTTVSSFLGETILRGYGASNLPPEHDLKLMSHLMQNSLLLSKGAGNRPLSANEDWADFLLGRGGTHEAYLSTNHPALNQRGQLVDRWGTPLFFHSLGSGKFDLRSAGPDKKMWTSDDIHRNWNGSLRRGEELNSPSLFPTNQYSSDREQPRK